MKQKVAGRNGISLANRVPAVGVFPIRFSARSRKRKEFYAINGR